MFIVFPAISMLLGWGLRGYIGGGPFGAMIPGAMVAMSISLLLELPVAIASAFVVFGVVGIGLGGEMTYGQTLGLLKSSDTMWWGTLGTTVKGAVWGLLGGTILAMGLTFKRLSQRTIVVSFILLLTGMLIGFKLINQPMLIYFSDPAKPRAESWGALLLGAIAVLVFLKYKAEANAFKIISRFAIWGLIGGGLGFGLGGFWLVLGFHLPKEVIFQSWWKAMEFSFGLLLGGALGYAAWLSRKEFSLEKISHPSELVVPKNSVLKEFLFAGIIGFLIFWLIAFFLDPVVDSGSSANGFTMIGLTDLAKIFSNYAFFGLIMIVAFMRFPSMAWQIAISLTFCHTVIDLVEDFSPEVSESLLTAIRLLIVVISTGLVAALTARVQRSKNVVRNMFLILIWSTIVVAFLRLTLKPETLNVSGLSLCKFVCGKFFVHIVFTLSALFCSWISIRTFNQSSKLS